MVKWCGSTRFYHFTFYHFTFALTFIASFVYNADFCKNFAFDLPRVSVRLLADINTESKLNIGEVFPYWRESATSIRIMYTFAILTTRLNIRYTWCLLFVVIRSVLSEMDAAIFFR
jgi:hypothetical protein